MTNIDPALQLIIEDVIRSGLGGILRLVSKHMLRSVSDADAGDRKRTDISIRSLIRHGGIHMLSWALSTGYVPTNRLIHCAIVCDNVDCLKLAWDRFQSSGYDLDYETARYGAMKCFIYITNTHRDVYPSAPIASSIGDRGSKGTAYDRARRPRRCSLASITRRRANRIMNEAIGSDSVKFVKYLIAAGYRLPPNACAATYKRDAHKCLRFLINRGCKLPANSLQSIYDYDAHKCLALLLPMGFKVSTDEVMKWGAYNCLKLLVDSGSAWSESTIASYSNWSCYLGCLDYAILNGCPHDLDVLRGMMNRESFEFIKTRIAALLMK